MTCATLITADLRGVERRTCALEAGAVTLAGAAHPRYVPAAAGQ
jgi:hypothetical protein